MAALRRVADDRAGPEAVGILLPPGKRTVLIVRPRVVEWDLVLVEGVAGSSFRELTREEAPRVADEFYRALERWCGGGPGTVQAVACTDRPGYQLWLDIEDYAMVACGRVPGQPYRPLVIGDEQAARIAAARIAAALRPPANGEREVYCNTRHFER
jgi:hypothetical protein